ncbi:MAG: carbohydrate kinase family protein [Gammaproteobacteria bacterium]|nr:carbohydrate kinase family protein [Gammaproteobacteria bacterium]
MAALICGSLAFDVIMVFQDHFKNHILPDKVHMLNVSFLVPTLRREFGGCAGNVAYTLKLLGGSGYPLGTVGEDFAPYAQWLDSQCIDRRYIETVPGSYTAQAYITSDLDDNQITAFHPGAMAFSAQVAVPDSAGITLGMVSPDSREGMLAHARQFQAAGIPFIFDPGQAMPLFNGDDLIAMIEQADWVTVNDYEFALIQERTGLSAAEIAPRVRALIVTCGVNGSYIQTADARIDIPAALAKEVVDPTGCGDAYRAGLLYGMMRGLDWETTGRIAALAGAYKIEKPGTQNHRFDWDEFRERFSENFGYRL